MAMVSVKLKFRPSAISGKEGSLYYQVIYNRVVRQLATSFHIYSHEWDSGTGRIVINPSSHRFYFLESVNRKVDYDINRIFRIGNSLSASSLHITTDTIITEFCKQKSDRSLFVYMEEVVEKYLRQGKCRTGETYSATLNSFRTFCGGVDIALEEINRELLEAYEGYLRQKGLSFNTISFYMKHLRAVYNRAVDDELVIDRHPFKRITTTIEKTAKRALSLKMIKQIKAMDFSGEPSKCFARDMFLFSFYTRGMAFVDIAFLQKKNLLDNLLSYRRKKTNQFLSIHWEKCMQDILSSYAAEPSSPYMFSIIKNEVANPRKQYLNAMCLVNRHLKAIGKQMGLHQPLTLYCARHSWASIARDEGIPLSVISEGMGHDSEKTTQIYLASLKTEVIDKANRKILRLL